MPPNCGCRRTPPPPTATPWSTGCSAELELTAHRGTRVDKLSGGQRKRASVAKDPPTGPSLLILDEPTSGLDPALDRQVMSMLRALADAGRVVVVVTHSLTYLGMCDHVLLLAPGGKTAYAGPPGRNRCGDGHHRLGRHLRPGQPWTPTGCTRAFLAQIQ